MKKNGFVFIETIIVTAVLTVSLLMIYLTFTVTLSNEKRRLGYDDTGYLYNTYYIETFLKSLELKTYINTYFSDNNVYLKQLSCDNLLFKDMTSSVGISQKNLCEKIIYQNSLNVSKVYISRYDLNTLKECLAKGKNCTNNTLKKNIENLNNNLVFYIRTLTKDPLYDPSTTYRLIIEYVEEELDYENVKNKKNGKCESDYVVNPSNSSKCIRKYTKYYYSNVNIKM